ncbi:alpha-ketoglutarate-dependent taurine dioxygenase [Obelidium mucronatum]|nr:alpha-ketoglutarate-dependent taurine dioxygenase [Obelidium mucronatum]
MSPVETQQLATATAALSLKDRVLKVQPLKRNYSLDAFKSFKVQPHIGTEFAKGIQIRDILKAPNSDELIKDFAVLTSERNVVFLRDQDITFEEQKEFVDRLGKAGGKPATSGLHAHPTTDPNDELGEQRLLISSESGRKYANLYSRASEFQSYGWHSDITFEHVPSDYAALRLREIPPEGGDTLWASAYEVASPATHSGDNFKQLAAAGLTKLNPGPRGAPEDGVFANKVFTKRINELSKDESDLVLAHLFDLIVQNHDLQVRFRWNKHDVATLTADAFTRAGDRATSLGERPYFDAASTSRR